MLPPIDFGSPRFRDGRCTRHNASQLLALAALLLGAIFVRPPSIAAQIKLPGQPSSAAAAPAPPAAPPAVPAAPAPPQAIPLPQIADQAETLDGKLEEISRGLTAQADEIKSNPTITGQSKEITERAHQVDSFLESGPDIVQLREEIVYWRALSRLAAEQRKQLTDRADELQNQITELAQQQAIWQVTQDSIHDAAGIEVVAARVQRELDAIRDLRLRAQTQLNQLLTQQNELSETGRKVSDTLTKTVRRGVPLPRQHLRAGWRPAVVKSLVHQRRPASKHHAAPLGQSGVRHCRGIYALPRSRSDFSSRHLWPGAGGGFPT